VIWSESRRDDRGLGLVGLLVTLALLGLLAAGAAVGLSDLPGKPATTLPGQPAAGAAPALLAPIQAAVSSACRADAASVEVAQRAFQALSTDGAFAGTSPTAGGIGLLVRAHVLRSVPGNATRYTIDTGSDGSVTVTNLRSTASASFEANPAICDGT
jgi:hypothetical protein